MYRIIVIGIVLILAYLLLKKFLFADILENTLRVHRCSVLIPHHSYGEIGGEERPIAAPPLDGKH